MDTLTTLFNHNLWANLSLLEQIPCSPVLARLDGHQRLEAHPSRDTPFLAPLGDHVLGQIQVTTTNCLIHKSPWLVADRRRRRRGPEEQPSCNGKDRKQGRGHTNLLPLSG